MASVKQTNIHPRKTGRRHQKQIVKLAVMLEREEYHLSYPTREQIERYYIIFQLRVTAFGRHVSSNLYSLNF